MNSAYLLLSADETLGGLTHDEVALLMLAGVVYECGGTEACPFGGHSGDGFLHYYAEKTYADLGRVLNGE